MRKIVLYTLMSLDGAVDSPDRYFAEPPEDGQTPEFDDVMVDFERESIGNQDAVLLGRGMYDEWSGFWPGTDFQPFSDFINGVTKHVLTSTPLSKEWSNATAVSGTLADVVRDLKAQPGKDIGVHGSITLAQSLLREGLVDELRLLIGPAIGCTGRRLFEGLDLRRLELVSAVTTPSSTLCVVYKVS